MRAARATKNVALPDGAVRVHHKTIRRRAEEACAEEKMREKCDAPHRERVLLRVRCFVRRRARAQADMRSRFRPVTARDASAL